MRHQDSLGLGISILLVWTLTACTNPAEPTVETAPSTAPPAAPATTMEAPTTDPAVTPTAQPIRLGKLAYVQEGDIWVKELPDGEDQRLTSDGRNAAPQWSPSGNWLMFDKGDWELFHRGDEVWVMRADGTDGHRIPTAPPDDCAWSPVADQLAYVSGQAALRIIGPDELADTGPRGEGHVLMQSAIEEEPLTAIQHIAWSPDGQKLTYTLLSAQPSGPPDRVSLGYVDLESGPRELYAPPSPPQDGLIPAGWTPDGQSILFWRDPMFSASAMADGLPLDRLPLDGSETVKVVDCTLLHSDFWNCSRSGQHAALTVGAGRETWTNKRIALVDLGTTEMEYLTEEAVAAFSPAFSPDGTRIVYAAAPDIGHAWGGDGAKIGAAQRRIWVMSADGSGQRPLTGDPDFRDERPLWSADGSYILFARIHETGHASLWLIDVANGALKRVVDQLTPAPEWFGNYGYIDWDEYFDWWTG